MRWDDPLLAVPRDRRRIATYRRLQSWWREHELQARPGFRPKGIPCGSRLHPDDVAEQPDLTFLHPGAAAHARERIRVVKSEGGQLDEGRLRHNLLTSMGIAFNLFGPLVGHPDAAWILRHLIPELDIVDEVVCEWAPKPKRHYLDDRTAFDAIVRFHDRAGRSRLVGIEVKYTEPLSAKVHDSARYREVHDQSGWFRGAAEPLLGNKTNQLWREALLAASLEMSGDVDRADVVVLHLSDDETAAHAIAALRSLLREPERVRSVLLEPLLAALAVHPEFGAWAQALERRYTDLSPNGRSSDGGQGPDAPAPRRRLAAPERVWPRDDRPAPDLPAWWIEAASWRLVAELTSRWSSTFTVLELHPGGGQYDCLSLMTEAGERIDLNRAGSGHIHGPPDGSSRWSWRGLWPELAATHRFDHAASLFAHHLGLDPQPDPISRPEASAYRFISEVLDLAGHRRSSRVLNGFLDSSDGSEVRHKLFAAVPGLDERRRTHRSLLPDTACEYWFLVRGERPVLVVHPTDGLAWKPDGSEHVITDDDARMELRDFVLEQLP